MNIFENLISRALTYWAAVAGNGVSLTCELLGRELSITSLSQKAKESAELCIVVLAEYQSRKNPGFAVRECWV